MTDIKISDISHSQKKERDKIPAVSKGAFLTLCPVFTEGGKDERLSRLAEYCLFTRYSFTRRRTRPLFEGGDKRSSRHVESKRTRGMATSISSMASPTG